MNTAMAPSHVNFHISLNASRLEASVEFYRRLFGCEPAKQRADYAKFELANPPLTLSLEPVKASQGGMLNHVGFRLSSAEELVELQRRLEMAGVTTQREEGVECCYARQTKFWLRDPDGTLWEFYVLEGDIEHRGGGQSSEHLPDAYPSHAAEDGRLASAPAAHETLTFSHRLGEAFPLPLPYADASLTEVQLQGSFNAGWDSGRQQAAIAEVRRALAPSGRLAIHVLTADREVDGEISLPGPAAAVKAVPVHRELLSRLEAEGFESVRLTKFGAAPCFVYGGAEMRETRIEAFAPAASPTDASPPNVDVVYLGPFREIVDDSGRVIQRGERVSLSRSQWRLLESGPLGEQFVALTSRAAHACGAPV